MIVTRFNGRGLLYNTKMIPGRVGRGDIGYPDAVHTYPEPGMLGTGIHINVGPGQNGTFPVMDFLYASPPVQSQCSISFPLTPAPQLGLVSRGTYSVSFIHKITADPPLGVDWSWLRFFNGSTQVWGITHKGSVLFDFGAVEPRKLKLTGQSGASLTSFTSWRHPTNQQVKYEIQVQPTNPKITVRTYTKSGDDWVIGTTITANPSTSVTADRFEIGLFDNQKSAFVQTTSTSQIHAWDTYDADGEFPNINFIYPDITASVWNGTSEESVEIEGEWDGAAVVPVIQTLRNPYREGVRGGRWIVPDDIQEPDGGYEVYGTDSNETYKLFTPSGTPPVGGWPLMCWGNTQYFVSGDWTGLTSTNKEMLYHLIDNGFAVCSFGVKNADSVNPTGTGPMFVRQLVGAKLCTRHVLDNHVGLLNPNKVIIGGHSAGGFIGMGAAITKNFVDTIYGRDFTLAGNGHGGTDPSYKGILVFDPPVNTELARSTDPTHPYWSIDTLAGYGVGKIHAVAAFLMGANATDHPSLAGVNMAELLTRNSSNVPPIRYHVGTSDTVIFPEQELELRTAALAAGVPYTYCVEVGVTHEGSPVEFSESFKPWMTQIVNS